MATTIVNDDGNGDGDVNNQHTSNVETIHVLWIRIKIPSDFVCEQTVSETKKKKKRNELVVKTIERDGQYLLLQSVDRKESRRVTDSVLHKQTNKQTMSYQVFILYECWSNY